MSKIYVEVVNEFIDDLRPGFAEIGWTITGTMAAGSRTTTYVIDAPDAPEWVDGWLCSPTLTRCDDGSVVVSSWSPISRPGHAG